MVAGWVLAHPYGRLTGTALTLASAETSVSCQALTFEPGCHSRTCASPSAPAYTRIGIAVEEFVSTNIVGSVVAVVLTCAAARRSTSCQESGVAARVRA